MLLLGTSLCMKHLGHFTAPHRGPPQKWGAGAVECQDQNLFVIADEGVGICGTFDHRPGTEAFIAKVPDR